MDLGLTEEQQMLRDFARDFLEKECPESYVRDMEEDAAGYSAGRLAQDGRARLDGPHRPGTIRRRRHGLPRPHGADRGVRPRAGPRPFHPQLHRHSRAARSRAARRKSRRSCPPSPVGDKIWTLAFTEPSARFDADGVAAERRRATATPTSSTARSSSSATATSPTTWSSSRAPAAAGEDGISLFAVDAKAPGVTHEPLVTVAADKQNAVKFDNVRVPATNLLGARG